MMDSRRERDAICRQLDAGVEAYDAATLSRLNRARQQALARAGHAGWWVWRWPLGGAAVALVVALALPGMLSPASTSPRDEAQWVAWVVDAPDQDVAEDLAFYITLDDTTP